MSPLVLFAGRAADRNPRAMAGAALLAKALCTALDTTATRVGEPAPASASASASGWQRELAAATQPRLQLQATLAEALDRQPVLCVMNRCAAALGTLPAVVKARPGVCVVWFDAHADSNTPTSSSTGYLGGMVLTGAAGLWQTGLGAGLALSNVVLVGSRDFDPFEKRLIQDGTLTLVETGAGLGDRLIAAIAGRPVYVHLDCDVLAPGLMPSEFQIPGGLTLAELKHLMELLALHEVVGLEVAELEATWPDGRPADVDLLIEAIKPLLCAGSARTGAPRI